VYDRLCVLGGEVENWIKEFKLELRADRLSCHRFATNQFRLLLRRAAYALFWLLRRDLKWTALSCAKICRARSDPHIIW